MRASPATLLFALVLVAALHGSSEAAQLYSVAGSDSFAIAGGDITSMVIYRGTETLSVQPNGRLTRLHAHVRYVRSDQGAQSEAEADYVADVAPDGTVVASADRDPDYLTVLNQPFAAQLDRATLRDLEGLRAPLPFDFPSPFTSSSLHGYLDKLSGGSIAGRSTAGVRFEAAGPMRGALPDRPGLTLVGTIAMRGSAFYDRSDALLLALDATVTISGYVSNRTSNDQVNIVYRRAIRAADGESRAGRCRCHAEAAAIRGCFGRLASGSHPWLHRQARVRLARLKGAVTPHEELANLSLAGGPPRGVTGGSKSGGRGEQGGPSRSAGAGANSGRGSFDRALRAHRG
jgi:hypothetical protein